MIFTNNAASGCILNCRTDLCVLDRFVFRHFDRLNDTSTGSVTTASSLTAANSTHRHIMTKTHNAYYQTFWIASLRSQ